MIDFHFVLFALMAVSPLSVASVGLARFGWIDSAGPVSQVRSSRRNFVDQENSKWLSIFETR
jgi:hypothetical protein